MLKSDTVLQIFIFGMVAAIVTLTVLRFYPEELLHPKKVIAAPPEVVIKQEKTGEQLFIPTQISVPSVNISLNISPGIISGNDWTLYDDKASWLSTSATLGKGNVIIYGHNLEPLLGNLKNIEVGDEIKILSNDKEFEFIVTEKKAVSPDQTNAVLSDENQITLYTCDGAFDRKRLIVIAKPKSPD